MLSELTSIPPPPRPHRKERVGTCSALISGEVRRVTYICTFGLRTQESAQCLSKEGAGDRFHNTAVYEQKKNKNNSYECFSLVNLL